MTDNLDKTYTAPTAPVLRLRPTPENEGIKERQLDVPRRLDGPWIRHPNEIKEWVCTLSNAQFPLDTDVENYRICYREHVDAFFEPMRQLPKSERRGRMKVEQVMFVEQLVDMERMLETCKDKIERAVEQTFVNCHIYLLPGKAMPPYSMERFGRDWSWNARGVYYRHHYSPHWVTADHDLWIPTIDDSMFDDPTEDHRRARARNFLLHVMDNERWNKAEYAWEADAWTDVFGQMRNDPALAADKREYYAEIPDVHPVSCTLTGKSRFAKRIPDATFGLATFRPEHYQNAVASYELDAERLQALALHRSCGLISDPRCGEADLVFPFAVYEAKGWNGDPREARHQACAAGAAYLDMMDALARVPGQSEVRDREYQFEESHSAQVFALTSFGAHWHIMVGYRRPRLKREHAGHPGVSDTVYLYQRVWSSRIADERSAWKLLYLVDQIHDWGVTTFRDYIIRHLKAWHRFGRVGWANDASTLRFVLGKDFATSGTLIIFDTPGWAKNFGADFKTALKQKSGKLLIKICIEEQPGEPCVRCVIGRCGTEHYPGYAIFSPEEHLRHFARVHNGTINESAISAFKEIHRRAALAVAERFKASHSEERKKRGLEEYNERKGKRAKHNFQGTGSP
ncbi:hypothetical protein CC80DRAFT_440179 [Byssothecium circinans]|uniref:Uncharacterized protein n=1 Tax=Byssothecium circinans TaxID=147558 RepID=A0A6A5UAR7_9PLEO|nr:hypothetical protein CC80DRAFT_440179 [Byssothecium circinans]